MVRVISVHHFANQSVQVIEQPTACAVAPPDRLLVALLSNCVEVRDLRDPSPAADALFSFPTVDEVSQLLHCRNGDYVATLETKVDRQKRESNTCRAYVNWDSVAAVQQSKMNSAGFTIGRSECGMVQPMRARIAGRVTPTTNQTELGNLEMIEVPTRRNPCYIDCCQTSGNLFVLSGHVVDIYLFKVKLHDISRMRFVDFEESPMEVRLCFAPTQLTVCENYVACMDKENIHLFRINERDQNAIDVEKNEDIGSEAPDLLRTVGPVDFGELVKNGHRNTATVNLPTVVRENSLVHRHSPFTFTDKELTAVVAPSGYVSEKRSYEVEDLVQLRLVPVVVESAQRRATEEFKCMVLRPLYIDESLNRKSGGSSPSSTLRSPHSDCLNSVTFVFATQQEGYLYHFDDADPGADDDNCLAVYPFTAPVFKLVMEDYFLHALTETGLESYTLRHGHQMCRNFEIVDDVNVACPPVNDPICLVGLRPFLGVEQIHLSENYLALLANSETSPAHSVSSNSSSNASFLTLYTLELPSYRAVFNDVSLVANVHRFTSANTYRQLLSEAHMALRLGLLLKRWGLLEAEGASCSVRLVAPRDRPPDEEAGLVETYRTSCALLGDHYVMDNGDDYVLAVPYYKMARISPGEVVKRVKKVREQSGSRSTKGLLHYLRRFLFDGPVPEGDNSQVRADSKRAFTESVLELLEPHSYRDLPAVVLKSRVVREYSAEKLLHILNSKMADVHSDVPERNLALAVLYLQKCNGKRARERLERVPEEALSELLTDNHELLFENVVVSGRRAVSGFSELTQLLIEARPRPLAELLVALVHDKRVVSVNKMIKVFLEYLPSSIGTDSSPSASAVLQKMLELYFERYFSVPENVDVNKVTYERGVSEALKLLVRSYLSQLQIIQMRGAKGPVVAYVNSDGEDDVKDCDQEKASGIFRDAPRAPGGPRRYLFQAKRHPYLDQMPPFRVEVSSKLREACGAQKGGSERFDTLSSEDASEADLILRKLQALLCSDVVPKRIVTEVEGFLGVNGGLRGGTSLGSIVANVNEGVTSLVEECPQCLLQYGKDRFGRTDEWKFLIATVQRKILSLSQDEGLERVRFFHKKILNDILNHLASTLPLDRFVQTFPQRFSDPPPDVLDEIQNYDPYVEVCRETMHADQMKQLIETTGRQLLKTLSFSE